jgi:hypothetical protein
MHPNVFLQVTVTVTDLTAKYALLGEEKGWFAAEEIPRYTSRADTKIKVPS